MPTLRESCKVDRAPFLAETRARLRASFTLLTDLLPKHVVAQMLGERGGGGSTAFAAEDGKDAWIVEDGEEGIMFPAVAEEDDAVDIEEVRIAWESSSQSLKGEGILATD